MWDWANGMTLLYLGGTPEIFYTIPKCEIFLFISELMNVLEVYIMCGCWILYRVHRFQFMYKTLSHVYTVNIRKVYLQRKANKKHNNLRDKTDWWEFRSWRKMHIFLWRASKRGSFFIPFFYLIVILYKWSWAWAVYALRGGRG